MSLDYDLKNIKNFEDVCFSGPDPEEEGCVLLESDLHCLIFGTMSTGLNEITEKNIPTWIERCAALDRIDYAIGSVINERGQRIGYVPERKDLEKYIGLKTNASPLTTAKFYKSIAESVQTVARRRAKDETE